MDLDFNGMPGEIRNPALWVEASNEVWELDTYDSANRHTREYEVRNGRSLRSPSGSQLA